MRLDQEAIKLCYSTHRQQTAVKNDYAYEAEPYSATSIANILQYIGVDDLRLANGDSATSIANILPEGCRLVGIKRGVTLFMLKNSIAAHLPDQRCDLGHIQEYNSCSFQANLAWKEQLIGSLKDRKHKLYTELLLASKKTS